MGADVSNEMSLGAEGSAQGECSWRECFLVTQVKSRCEERKGSWDTGHSGHLARLETESDKRS